MNWTFENETLAQDISAFEKQLDAAISDAMQTFYSDIILLLYEHLESDVYAAYKPSLYLRRRDDPELGESLEAFGRNTKKTQTPDTITVDYSPDGEHPQFERPLHGDDLIRRIEQGGKWEWRNKHMKARPFMKRMTEELIEGGRAEQWLVEALNTANADLNAQIDMNAQRESRDWVF